MSSVTSLSIESPDRTQLIQTERRFCRQCHLTIRCDRIAVFILGASLLAIAVWVATSGKDRAVAVLPGTFGLIFVVAALVGKPPEGARGINRSDSPDID